jgi:sugar lactone lactonase YvrE
MANALRTWVDRFLGRGEAAVTVPALDGALKPNNLLEDAPAGIKADAPDDLVLAKDALIYSSGATLFRIASDRTAAPVHTAPGVITAIAAAPSGLIAVASENGGLAFVDGVGQAGKQAWANVTAMHFADDKTLLLTIGSTENRIADWQRDLLNSGASGELWSLDIATGVAHRIASRLAYPNGVVVEKSGDIVVSESWKKRLIRLSSTGRMLDQVLEDLPGYPARLSRSTRGGYWLSVFAPRSQLIEFVLREPKYRKAMMAEVAPEYWIAPALRSGSSFHEPMQGGALKQMGILKPWAPTRSYGLVIELTPDFEPVRSLHSRAGGRRHGVTAALDVAGTLWCASKGGDEVVAIDLNRQRG